MIIFRSKTTNLKVPHAQGDLVVPYHQADPEYREVLALPSQRWVLELDQGHQEGLQVKGNRQRDLDFFSHSHIYVCET